MGTDCQMASSSLPFKVIFSVMSFVVKDKNVVVFTFDEAGLLWNSKKKLSFLFSNNDLEVLKTDHESFSSLLKLEVIQMGSGTSEIKAKPANPEVDPEDLTIKAEKAQPPIQPNENKMIEKTEELTPSQQNEKIEDFEARNLAFSQASIPVLAEKNEVEPENLKEETNNNDSLN